MMGSANPQATAAAMTEYILTCTDCQNEFKKLGLIYTNSHANPYSILATKPIIKPEDMNGIRLRTASPQHARWVEAMGGTAVSMPTGEAFEAISQRVVDGTVTSVSDVISFNLGDVITHITLLDLGTFHSLANHAVKDSVWKELSVSEREALMKASIVANVLTTARWVEMVEEGKGVARDKKLEILEPSAELIAKTEAFKAQDSADAAGRAQSRFGIEGAEEKIARFQALVEKWEGLIAEKGDSKDAIVALYESEILPKIDLEKYGQ
jgi:TRAP-type C4-dicarboxylate transport system substrate-binding protein